MIQVETYSPKGLVVKGATPEQAETIRAALGPSVCAQHNAKLGGYVFSRKREEKIRELVAAMQATRDDLPGEWMADALEGRGAPAA
jgi:hypothetical protein